MNYTFYLKTDVKIDEHRIKNLVMQALLNEDVYKGKCYTNARDKAFASIEKGRFVSVEDSLAQSKSKSKLESERATHKEQVFEVWLNALGSKRIVEIPVHLIKENASCAPYHFHCNEPKISDINGSTSIVVDLLDIVHLYSLFNNVKYKFKFDDLEGDKERAKTWASKISSEKLLRLINPSNIRHKNIPFHYVLSRGFYMPDSKGHFCYVLFKDLEELEENKS